MLPHGCILGCMTKRTIILLIFILAKFILQYLLVNPAYDLHRDEYLHLDQANHPAWGYISVPPFTSWIAVIIKLLGNGVFWVKFFPALFGAATVFVVWRIVELLKGNLYACILSASALLFSVLLRINILFQPNSTDIFFWTLLYYALIRYVTFQRPRWLYICAIIAAFGFLSKYNVLVLFASLLPAFLLTKQRMIFKSPHLYAALALGVALISPNLIWQYNNHFPTYYQLKELAETQLVHVQRWDFAKDQLVFFYNSIFVLIAALAGFFFYRPFAVYRFAGWSFLAAIILFMAMKAKSYYAIGLYPVLLAFGSVYIEYLFRSRKLYFLKPVTIAVVIGLSVPFLLIAFPVYTPGNMALQSERYKKAGMLRWEDGRDHEVPQDFADMLGWKELAQKVDSTYSLAAASGYTVVLCSNYGEAGAINYYSRNKNINAISFNADYINWFRLDKPVVNLLIIDEPGKHDLTPLGRLFESVQQTGAIQNIYARERGTVVILFKGAHGDINAWLKTYLEKAKAHE